MWHSSLHETYLPQRSSPLIMNPALPKKWLKALGSKSERCHPPRSYASVAPSVVEDGSSNESCFKVVCIIRPRSRRENIYSSPADVLAHWLLLTCIAIASGESSLTLS
ncbi:hypothetical protein BDR06DRAFT_371489 [Suillus hirtellus]|nr:hypothetical protein BDR06DRAFT_371489 [Suillus hirtellus]